MKRLDIFEFAEQHKDCPIHTKEYEIGGRKYIVHSHFLGDKDVHKVLFENALNKALNETFGSEAMNNCSIETDYTDSNINKKSA